MALLVCPDCGNKVSDQAQNCPVCGCPVSSMLEIKMKENEATEKAVKLELEAKKQRIQKIAIITVIAVITVVIAAFFIIKNINENAGALYENPSWGTSKEKVLKKYPNGSKDDGKNDVYVVKDISEYLGIENLNMQVNFSFEDEALSGVGVLINSSKDMTVSEVRETLVDKLTQKYGAADRVNLSSFVIDMWETDKSHISLVYAVADGNIVVMYKPLEEGAASS